MKGKFDGSYKKSKTGGGVTTVFRYVLTGTAAEIESYKAAQGDNYREQDTTGLPLMFTTRFSGKSVNLIETQTGNWVVDNSEVDQLASVAEQYAGTQLGTEIAKLAAQKILGTTMVANTTAAASVNSAVAPEEANLVQ